MKCLYISLILALVLTSCSDYETISQESPRTNTVKSGQKFRIILPENHTTGYMWQISNSYDEKHIGYINSVWHGNEKGVYFNFVASEKGTATLNFTLIKYRDTSTVKSFIIDIK